MRCDGWIEVYCWHFAHTHTERHPESKSQWCVLFSMCEHATDFSLTCTCTRVKIVCTIGIITVFLLWSEIMTQEKWFAAHNQPSQTCDLWVKNINYYDYCIMYFVFHAIVACCWKLASTGSLPVSIAQHTPHIRVGWAYFFGNNSEMAKRMDEFYSPKLPWLLI